MSHFYGTLEGSRGKATRRGTKNSGITTHAAGWGGAIRVDVFERDGVDHYRVTLVPWQSGGAPRGANVLLSRDEFVLAEGVLTGSWPAIVERARAARLVEGCPPPPLRAGASLFGDG